MEGFFFVYISSKGLVHCLENGIMFTSITNCSPITFAKSVLLRKSAQHLRTSDSPSFCGEFPAKMNIQRRGASKALSVSTFGISHA